MKITAKTTKEQLKEFLNEVFPKVKDENLAERIAYALAAEADKVTRKDLVDLAKEYSKLVTGPVAEAPVEPTAENSVKKLSKGVSKKQKSMEDSSEKSEKSEETAEEPKEEKVAEKPKKTLKKEKPLEATVECFPEKLKVGDSNYELAHDIESMEDLYKALEKDEEIVFAFYYSRKMLKMAPYFYDMLGHPKSFDNDLDLATTIYVSEEKKIAYHISMYTEGCYNTLPEDFEELEGIRYAGTMQYQIYRAVPTEV